mgnify:CR=1 FL=1
MRGRAHEHLKRKVRKKRLRRMVPLYFQRTEALYRLFFVQTQTNRHLLGG